MAGPAPTGAFANAAALATGAHSPYITGLYLTTAGTVTFTLAGNAASVSIALPTGWFTGVVASNITSIGTAVGYMFW